MKIETWRCDRPGCDREFRPGEGLTVWFHVGTTSDPVDGHTRKRMVSADLCLRCVEKILCGALVRFGQAEQFELAKLAGAKWDG